MSSLRVLSWNIAAINNNPFEYFLTHPDPDYDKLMLQVQQVVEAPGAHDVALGSVLTPQMYSELAARMAAQGWEGLDEVGAIWESDLSRRAVVSGFLKDKQLGAKRLVSMPDRLTNTISLAEGGVACRPTLISNFEGDMSSSAKWWSSWLDFMFASKLRLPAKKGSAAPSEKAPVELLGPIPRAKYPSLTEDEERLSTPLQTLCLALFDAALLHLIGVASPGGEWLGIKRGIVGALLHQKESLTVDILRRRYADVDVLCLQEVRAAFAGAALPAAFADTHAVFAPATPSRADQNSVLLLRRDAFDVASASDVTAAAHEKLPAGAGVSAGDLLVVSCARSSGEKLLLASFHGDTDGVQTLGALRAVGALAEEMADHSLVFGIDANSYGPSHAAPHQLGVAEFVDECARTGFATCWGEASAAVDVGAVTCYCARTYMQPQLQKAVRADEKAAKGDHNLKDYVVFPRGAWRVASAIRDNTGEGRYVEQCLPTLTFPSDHSLIVAELSAGAGTG